MKSAGWLPPSRFLSCLSLEIVVSEQFSGLLRLRAAPPVVPPGFLPRPRLEGRLTAAVDHPVTLVSAGPGYGKTLSDHAWPQLRYSPPTVRRWSLRWNPPLTGR